MGGKMERIRGLEADHHQVCKFTEDDVNWHTVLTHLEAIAYGIQEEFELPKPDATNENISGVGTAPPRVLQRPNTPPSNRRLLTASEWDEETFGDLRVTQMQ